MAEVRRRVGLWILHTHTHTQLYNMYTVRRIHVCTARIWHEYTRERHENAIKSVV